MSKRTTVITLGIFVAIMPFLGFPGVVRTFFFVLAGLIIAAIGYSLELPVNSVKEDDPEREQEINT